MKVLIGLALNDKGKIWVRDDVKGDNNDDGSVGSSMAYPGCDSQPTGIAVSGIKIRCAWLQRWNHQQI